MIKINKIQTLFLIISLSIFVRIFAALYFADLELKNEWAILFHNFKMSGIYGFNVVVNEYYAVPKFASPGDTILPSVFMPPLYFYFILFVDTISFQLVDTVNLLLTIQVLLNIFSIIILYKIVSKFEYKNLPILISFIFAFFPLNIYASVQVSSVTLQIFLILSFLFYFIELIEENKFKNLFLFSFVSGFLILIRGEFILFYFFSLIYLLILNKKIKTFIISAILTILVISPYLVRNYYNFNTLVLTKSFGYNLLKGNNPTLKAEGNPSFIEEEFDRKNLNIKADNRYEINLDNFYKERAFDNIKSDSIQYMKFYLLKIFSFVFFDFNSSYPNYYNLFHLIPKILISLLSIFGAIFALRKKGFFQFISIFYIINICLFSIFFILPRYSLILLPIKLLLSIFVLKKLARK